MEGGLRILIGLILTLCLGALSTGKPDAGWTPTYTTTISNTKSDTSYWNTGNEVAVYLIIIPLLLIPLILIGLKIAERGGEYGGADGHYIGGDHHSHHKRAFKAVSNSVLNHLTKVVLDAIKE